MSDIPTCTWIGQSGHTYTYWIYPIGSSFKEQAGNYIFAKETGHGRWTACYIGQTDNLNERLGNHEKEACARRNGATHIQAHLNSNGVTSRRAEEKDLILRYRPPCNEQLT